MNAPVQRYYLPQLNGLRFTAFFWVLLDHSRLAVRPHLPVELQHIIAFAWIGMELLFVHAAFLFTKLLHMEQQTTGSVSAAHFYARRILRIMPAYYIYIAAILIVYAHSIHWNQYTILRCIGLLTFTDNIFAAMFGKFNPIPWTAHLYTVSDLMQLYLLIPWLYTYLEPMPMRRKAFTCLAFSGLAILARYVLVLLHVNRLVIPMWLVLHPEFFLTGMFLAFAMDAPGMFDARTLRAAWLSWGIAALLLLVFMTTGHGADVVDMRQLYLYPVTALALGGLIVMVVRSRKDSGFSRLLCGPFMNYLGKIIYGLYIYHFCCIPASLYLLHSLGWKNSNTYAAWLAVLLTALTMTIGLASLSYPLIERPFLRIKERYATVLSRPV